MSSKPPPRPKSYPPNLARSTNDHFEFDPEFIYELVCSQSQYIPGGVDAYFQALEDYKAQLDASYELLPSYGKSSQGSVAVTSKSSGGEYDGDRETGHEAEMEAKEMPQQDGENTEASTVAGASQDNASSAVGSAAGVADDKSDNNSPVEKVADADDNDEGETSGFDTDGWEDVF